MMKAVIVSEMQNTPGTREWRMVEKGEALFHCFGSDFEEFENGAASYTAAVVEWPDGSVEMVRADRIRFVTPSAKPADSAATEAFELWWTNEGQFCRAGGGEYEKTFAFRGYEAGIAASPLRALAQNFEVTGPDADGLLWLVLHGHGTTGSAMFNLGRAGTISAEVLLMLEADRRAALRGEVAA